MNTVDNMLIGYFLSDVYYENKASIYALITVKPSMFEDYLWGKGWQYILDCSTNNTKPNMFDCAEYAGLNVGDVGQLVNDNQISTPSLLNQCVQQFIRFHVSRTRIAKVKGLLKSLESGISTSEQDVLLSDTFASMLETNNESSNLAGSAEIVAEFIKDMNTDIKDKLIATNDPLIDKILKGGFGRQQITIIGGESGTGKSTIASKLLTDFSFKQDYHSAFFTLEMTKTGIIKRTLAQYLQKTEDNLTLDDCSHSLEMMIEKDNLSMSSKRGQTIESIYLDCRIRSQKSGLDAVFIDFLTLIATESKESQQYLKIDHIMNYCAKISQDFNCSVFILAQLNRASSANGRPTMTSFKGSTSIENAADNMIGLYRAKNELGHFDNDFLEVNFMKVRYGEMDTVYYKTTDAVISQCNQKEAALAMNKEDLPYSSSKFVNKYAKK